MRTSVSFIKLQDSMVDVNLNIFQIFAEVIDGSADITKFE